MLHVKDFIPRGPLDPTPYGVGSRIGLAYCQDAPRNRAITLSWNETASRWSDYAARERRAVAYLGINTFVPACERKDFAFKNAHRLTIDNEQPLTDIVREKVCQLLNLPYDGIRETRANFRDRPTRTLRATKQNLHYSEANMGCGEARIHNMVSRLEALPEKCLVLLEEPEISLHQSVQYRLGWYFMDLALRRGHQIICSTHSEPLMSALPTESRISLVRTEQGVRALPRISSVEAESLLFEGHRRALTVLVEDDVARAVLSEIALREDANFAHTLGIFIAGSRNAEGRPIGGGKDGIKAAMRGLAAVNLKLAGVVDADVRLPHQTQTQREEAERQDRREYIFKLPGEQPPEVEMAQSASLDRHVRDTYQRPLAELMGAAGLSDYHGWLGGVARLLNKSREEFMGECARAYVAGVSPAARTGLIDQLKEAARR